GGGWAGRNPVWISGGGSRRPPPRFWRPICVWRRPTSPSGPPLPPRRTSATVSRRRARCAVTSSSCWRASRPARVRSPAPITGRVPVAERSFTEQDPERGRQRREVGDHRQHEGERREHAELPDRRGAGPPGGGEAR